MIFQLAPYRWDKRGNGHDYDGDLDGDGGPLHPVRAGHGTGACGGLGGGGLKLKYYREQGHRKLGELEEAWLLE